MQLNYPESYRLVREHEGGYVNHPDDPGGATKWGVIQRNYDAYRRRKGLRIRGVQSITEKEAAEIYKTQYWDKVDGDALPYGVDYAVFDFAVNSGVSLSAKFLQRIVQVRQDGVIGNATIDAVKIYCGSGPKQAEELIATLCENRMAFLRRLRHWKSFKTGWTRRVMGHQPGFQAGDKGVIDVGIMMARKENTENVTHREARGKGEGPFNMIGAIVEFLAGLFGSK